MNKLKEWYNENRTEVQVGILLAVMTSVGYIAGKYVTAINTDAGVRFYIDKGVMKFINPKTGVEAKTYTDAVKLLKDINNGKVSL